jgi:hypothetical protein
MSHNVEQFIKDIGECFEGTFWGFNKLEISRTCSACPEQYDIKIDGEPAGYLRLRHSEFRADFPDCGGETVYESEAMNGDGLFDAEERGKFIGEAVTAVIDAWTKTKKAGAR